jgi:hypothetical protein
MAEHNRNKRAYNFKDLTGQTFGRLTVVALSKEKQGRNCCWICSCECGASVTIRSGVLINGTTQSCGCLQRERAAAFAAANAKPRIIPKKEYGAWRAAKHRCTNQKSAAYPSYGGRGITMCDEWMNDPRAFYRDMGPCPKGLSLDRIDNNRGYSPDNCRWTDQKTQSRNQRRGISITHDGLTLPIKEWAERTGIDYRTLLMRWRKGLDLFAPVRSYNRG